jgi:CarD family transcriptional regulator
LSQGRFGLYDVGDKVVYPHHGAGTVVKKEKREVLGEQREYLTIKILHNDMTVQVPSENAEKVGLRRVIGEKEVGVVLKTCADWLEEVLASDGPPAKKKPAAKKKAAAAATA